MAFVRTFNRACILDIVTVAVAKQDVSALWMAMSIYAQKHPRHVLVRHILLLAMMLSTSQSALQGICDHVLNMEKRGIRHDSPWASPCAFELGSIASILADMPRSMRVIDRLAFHGTDLYNTTIRDLTPLEKFIHTRVRGDAGKVLVQMWIQTMRVSPDATPFSPSPLPTATLSIIDRFVRSPSEWSGAMRYVSTNYIGWVPLVLSKQKPTLDEHEHRFWVDPDDIYEHDAAAVDLILADDSFRYEWRDYEKLNSARVVDRILEPT